MNKYVSKLFSAVFQSQQAPQVVRAQRQQLPMSPEEWRQHWQLQEQPWRTEPEIDAKRQSELTQQRAVTPNIEQGIYPFKGVKLNRADIEWLLATHENGRGPVDWSDESQREREGLDLRGADLRYADLQNLPLARLRGALRWKESPGLTGEHRRNAEILLEGAKLKQTHLEGALLTGVHLENADVEKVCLEGAYLIRAHLENTFLNEAHLERANLTGAYMEGAFLRRIHLGDKNHIGPRLVDIQWGDTNLAIVNWTQVKMLDDEYDAKQKKQGGRVKERATHINEYEKAVRANRQLAVELQGQGLNEDAARFAYRAQALQQQVFWMQRSIGKWFFSLLLALLAGYGYRMWRILAAYAIVVSFCAVAYFAIGIYHAPHLTLLQAFLESITAFHGRVFYELFTPDTPQIWVTAFEAISGLVIESVFIAMLTQRFFGK